MSETSSKDLVRRPLGALLLWCLPIGVGFATFLARVPPRITAVVWAVLFVWMGAGCLVNAYRCRRLHCYISGPIFLIGAVVMTASAFSPAPGLHMLGNIVSATLLLALLSFVPEMIWRRYA